jgi:Ca2+-binding EF-hand superfamily protein
MDFLVEEIKIKKDDLNEGKINRLFKLMDQYKRGRVTCEDFKRFLCEVKNNK